jgi:hypothetical protein
MPMIGQQASKTQPQCVCGQETERNSGRGMRTSAGPRIARTRTQMGKRRMVSAIGNPTQNM